ncbi:glycosyltransferase [uncultured Eubacterium sp.]|uniref:glycosyltransferase n=1 Tax=uncultured Eubacterium sp. TaxID=165185 RepID=UPI002588B046|nr:glycosyltransferase [uncultured Eubacterium sp.]
MKKKKDILVVFTGPMELGGIERSLLGLLDSIDYNEYNVDLFLYAHHGPLMYLINENVNVLPEEKELAYLRESFGTKLKNRAYYSAYMRCKEAVISKFTHINHDEMWAEIMRKKVKPIKKHYDLALGFFRPFDLIDEKIYADIKVGWIHTDYSSAREDLELLRKDYAKMDYIVGVSDQTVRTFIELFPEFESKVIIFENIISESFMKSEADKLDVSNEMKDNCVKLLSIGRFCEAKNFDNVPEIASVIKSKGVDFKWYIIGYGADENLIKSKIAQYNMEDTVSILGKRENPYPYIKACDIYVQPSRYEGKCVAVREAQILNKPVIITNYASSKSQLQDGFDGVIVPMDNQGCANGIVKVIYDKDLQNQLIENTKKTDYTNSKEIEKLYKLIGE